MSRQNPESQLLQRWEYVKTVALKIQVQTAECSTTVGRMAWDHKTRVQLPPLRYQPFWGYNSVGRVSALQAECRQFNSDYLHHFLALGRNDLRKDGAGAFAQ